MENNMYISRNGESRLKPDDLKLQWNVGDVVVLIDGKHALVAGYGIYDGQYWLEKYYGDETVHLAGADYEFSDENEEAIKNRVACIVRKEGDKEIVNKVINAYIAAQTDNLNMFYDHNKKYYPEVIEKIQKHIEFYKHIINAELKTT